MRCHWMSGGRGGLRSRLYARSRWNAELGKGAGQLGTGSQPSDDLQRQPEAFLPWWRIDDRPADCPRVEVLVNPPELLAWLWGDAGHCVADCVSRAEGGLRRLGAQLGRRLGGHAGVRTKQHGKQASLPGEHREHALLSWLAGAGDYDRAGQPGAGDARLGRSLRQRWRGQRDDGGDTHDCGKSDDNDQPAQHWATPSVVSRLCYTATHRIGTALRSQWPLITKATKVRATRPTRPVTCQQPSVGNITPEALNPVSP